MPKALAAAFLDELKDAYHGEKQLTRALPRLAKSATDPDLQHAFALHLAETKEHVLRLEQVFALLGETPKGKTCDGLAGIIEEGRSIMEEDFADATMDACLIAAGQRAEHYEMAAYGTLIAWAEAMGHKEAARILESILDEERAADRQLTALAASGIHRQAASDRAAGLAQARVQQPTPNRPAPRRSATSSTGGGARTVRTKSTKGSVGSKRATAPSW